MRSLRKFFLSSPIAYSIGWFLLGLILRGVYLTVKPIWMDEVATVIFTLGNSSYSVPLDQVISLDQLLTPLQPRPEATVSSAITYLMQEDNHPPAYFALAHLWMDLFPPVGVASPWAVRALPALLGALSVPVLYWVGWLSFRSSVAGHLSAAFMAVSPFGISLAQEARHYSLATLMVALCLACFAVGAWSLRGASSPAEAPAPPPISPGFALLWIGINALAFATHYFIALTFLAQAGLLAILAWQQARSQPQALWSIRWRRLYWVMLGTLATCLAWLPVLLNFYGSRQSSNLEIDFSQPIQWINPIAQMLAGLIFMVITPITHARGWLGGMAIGLSVLLLLPVLLGTTARLLRARRLMRQQSAAEQFGVWVMGGFVLIAIGLFFAISYGVGMDITRGHRYNFVFYPGVIALIGGLLAVYWPHTDTTGAQSLRLPLLNRAISGRRSVQIIWAASCLSALFVVTNLALAKYYNPGRFVETVQAESAHPVLIGVSTPIEEKPTVIGHELLSVGWEIHRHFNPDRVDSHWQVPPRFFLWTLPQNPDVPPSEKLANILVSMPRPFDLWFLNTAPDLSKSNCTQINRAVKGGHNHSHYECLP